MATIVPRPRLLELGRRFIDLTNDHKMGDLLGMCQPTACLYGAKGVDKYNVTVALFWEDHPELRYVVPDDDDAWTTRPTAFTDGRMPSPDDGADAVADGTSAGEASAPLVFSVVEFPFQRNWRPATGEPRSVSGVETLVFDAGGLIVHAAAQLSASS